MKVLVTGGAGFIGLYLVEKLLARNFEVIVIDDLSTGSRKKLSKKAKLYVTKVENAKEVNQIFASEKPNVVFHLAAQISAPTSIKDPTHDALVNVIGSINVFKAAVENKASAVIFSSTAAVYGDTKDLPVKETTTCNPIAPYGISKLTAEKYLAAITNGSQTRAVTLRYSNLYGVGQQLNNGEGGVTPILINSILKNQTFTLYGDGSHTRDFINVKDAVEANLQAMDSQASGLFQISTNEQTTISKLIEIVENAVGRKVNMVKSKPKDGDIYKSCLSNSLAKKQLGFTPRVKLVDGIKETVEFTKNELKSDQ